ncbi:MAG TPA: TolC family protein [Polyangiaceae bacterium]|nr:TolC family protein [Polyangiaceae bacterium]
MSLEAAVSLAVRQNPALAAAGASVAAAEAERVTARGLDDPVLSASAGIERTRRERVPGTPVQQRALDQLGAGVSVTQPLPIGGRVALSLDTGRARTEFSTESSAQVLERSTSEQYTPALQLRLEQPLLRGLGVDVARADRRRARAGRDLAGAEREGLAAALVRDVVHAYWTLAFARQQLAIRSSSVTDARDQLERVQANIAVGKLPPSATAEIEVAIALREDARLLAEQDSVEAQVALGRLCGAGLDSSLVAAESLPPLDPLAPLPHELEATLALALSQSPQLEALRAQTRAATIEVEVTENGLLPQLDLSLAGGPLANAPTARAAFDQLTGLGSYALMANVALELPIGRHAAWGARAAARAGLRRAELGVADVRAQITAAVAQGIAGLETARRRALLLIPSLKSAALDLEAERARFDAGRGSNFDVLRRQDALAVMQLLSLSAELGWQRASASLEALTGEILTRHRVLLATESD